MKDKNLNITALEKLGELTELTEAINAAEGRARQRTVSAKNVVEAIAWAEKKLNGRIAKARRGGIGLRISGGECLPKSYKNAAYCTVVRLVLTRRGWELVDIERRYNDDGGLLLTLNEEQRAEVSRNLYAGWCLK
ncbi:hypothetical protein FACS1894196_3600 [Clostridia bacterium]|nr:hypothetical protein FACS1894196_3600 [Clostridia bacterium]